MTSEGETTGQRGQTVHVTLRCGPSKPGGLRQAAGADQRGAAVVQRTACVRLALPVTVLHELLLSLSAQYSCIIMDSNDLLVVILHASSISHCIAVYTYSQSLACFSTCAGHAVLGEGAAAIGFEAATIGGGRPVLQNLLSSAFQCFPGFPMLFMTVMISCGQAFCSQTLSDIYSLTAKHRAWVSKQGMIRGNDIGLGSCCCGETGKQRYVDTSDLTYKLYVCFRYKSTPVPVRNIYMNCTYVNT